MPVVSVTKVFNERIVRDAGGIRLYENYRVAVSALSDSIGLAVAAVDPATSLAVPNQTAGRVVEVPIEGGESVPCYLQSVEPQRGANKLEFIVLCTYQSQGLTAEGPADANVNGNWSLSFGVRAIEVTEKVSVDKDGNAILNAAGEPYDDVTKTFYDEEITISFKTLNPPVDAIADLKGKTNDASCEFTINGVTRTFPENTLKFFDWEYSYSDSEAGYWTVSLKFYERPDGWTRFFINEGTYYLDADGNRVPAPFGGKCLLDLTGKLLPATEDPADYTTIVNLEKRGDFSPLFDGL
jgi:hypothetical protein